jgi:hypothetical protein
MRVINVPQSINENRKTFANRPQPPAKDTNIGGGGKKHFLLWLGANLNYCLFNFFVRHKKRLQKWSLF